MPSPTKKRRNRASVLSVRRRRTNRKSKTRNTKKNQINQDL